MPPKKKSGGKQDKSKAPVKASEGAQKLKAANSIKVRHILCEKQSKCIALTQLALNEALEAMAKLKEVSTYKPIHRLIRIRDKDLIRLRKSIPKIRPRREAI